MLREERTERILQYLAQHGFAKIQEIMELCNVSRPTALRDLIRMENEGLLIRTHGGARSIRRTTAFEPRHRWKESQHAEEKKKSRHWQKIWWRTATRSCWTAARRR